MRMPWRSLLIRWMVPAIDSAILWCFGFRKVRSADGGFAYVDPLDPDRPLTRAMALHLCHKRAGR